MELDLLAYWKLKESTWPKLAKMAKLAIPGGALLVGRRRARLLRRWQDARQPSQVGKGQHARALPVCCLQHRLMEDLCDLTDAGPKRVRGDELYVVTC